MIGVVGRAENGRQVMANGLLVPVPNICRCGGGLPSYFLIIQKGPGGSRAFLVSAIAPKAVESTMSKHLAAAETSVAT